MLSFLKIENLAIIENLSLELGPGLTVLTGETGAGKSIIVDSIALLAGERGGADLIRTGCDRLGIEGIFETEGDAAIDDLLRGMGFDTASDSTRGDGSIVVRREITAAGRSRAFVNGSLATLQQIKLLGEALADIHGQHQHQSLLRAEGQREALDRAGVPRAAVARVEETSAALRALLEERESLRSLEKDRARRQDELEAVIAEIGSVNPTPQEEIDLRGEESVLRHAEEIRLLAEEACQALNEDDASILERLGAVRERIVRLAAIDPRAEEALRGIEEARVGLKEALRSIEPYREAGDLEPGRLDAIAGRLAAIERLKRRHGPTIEDALAVLAAARRDLDSLGGVAERLDALDAEIARARDAYLAAAGDLSRKRRSAARALETSIHRELKALGMAACRFSVAMGIREDPRSEVVAEGRRAAVSPDGYDAIEFLISPNPGEEPRALARIASGGELSRLMLALRTAAESGKDGRVLVFDEVDAGVGGATAESVGQRLASLAKHHQVMCVTHQPQIAALADRHLTIGKETSGGRTRVVARPLEGTERVEELARMIGSEQAPTARRHAAALINARKET